MVCSYWQLKGDNKKLLAEEEELLFKNYKFYLTALTVFLLTMMFATPVFAQSVNLTITPAGQSYAGDDIVFRASATGVSNPEYQFGFRHPGGSWIPLGTPSRSNTFRLPVPANFSGGNFQLGVTVRESGGSWLASSVVNHTVIEDRRTTTDGFYANFGYDAIPRTNHSPWIWWPSTLWRSGESSRFSNGRTGEWVSASAPGPYYHNFDYSAMIHRPFDETSAQYIVIRAGTKLDSDHAWYPGYFFGYANTGRFVMGARFPDGSETFTGWSSTPAINRFERNTLRVRAVGDTMRFYINNNLIATARNSLFTRGRVGVTAYSNPYETGNHLFGIYWARLETLSAPASLEPLESVSPEHEILNFKATENLNNGVFHMKGDFSY